MSNSDRPTIHVMPGHAKRLRQGHPWAFSNELRMDAEAKALAPGAVVRVADAGGEVLGCATFNPHSLIALRLLARDGDMVIDTGFFRDRFVAALALRERLVTAPHYRLIHAEADGLPGLAVPAGLSGDGLPLGLQLIGRPFEEETLFAIGSAIEQAAGRFEPAKWW